MVRQANKYRRGEPSIAERGLCNLRSRRVRWGELLQPKRGFAIWAGSDFTHARPSRGERRPHGAHRLLWRRRGRRRHLAEPVSYTHLRAHETDSYLVCRLLLEKKK